MPTVRENATRRSAGTRFGVKTTDERAARRYFTASRRKSCRCSPVTAATSRSREYTGPRTDRVAHCKKPGPAEAEPGSCVPFGVSNLGEDEKLRAFDQEHRRFRTGWS